MTLLFKILQNRISANNSLSMKLNNSYGRFLELKIRNSLVYVADNLKKLRGCGQPNLINVNIVLM